MIILWRNHSKLNQICFINLKFFFVILSYILSNTNMPNVFAKYCQECYSKSSRATPLLKPKQCLENHTQYICGTCGRCICVEQDEKRGVRRWNFPFKTLEIAKLYLRAAEQCCQSTCGIYEIKSGTGRKSYKIFASQSDLLYYLSKNKKSSCFQMQPLFENSEFKIYKETSVRKLTSSEVVKYLKQMKKNNYSLKI